MRNGVILAEEASTFLLHTAALQYFPLANRRPLITTQNTVMKLTSAFTRTAACLLRDHELLEQLNLLSLPINLADLLDGFLLASLTRDVSLRNRLLANPAVEKKYDSLLGALVQASGGSFERKLAMKITTDFQDSKDLSRCCYSTPGKDRTILPFRNAIFDRHLAPVHLRLNGVS